MGKIKGFLIAFHNGFSLEEVIKKITSSASRKTAYITLKISRAPFKLKLGI